MGLSGRIAALFQNSRMTPLLALVAFLLGCSHSFEEALLAALERWEALGA